MGGGNGETTQLGEPLLAKKAKAYRPRCPGCRVDRLNAEREGVFPLKDLFLIWLVTITCTLPIQSLFPFLYFMIRDLHIAKQTQDIGFYAGFVVETYGAFSINEGASYMCGRAVSSTVWGIVADKYGRKPVIVLTLIAIVIFNTMFGLSSNYWMALITRCLLGIMCGYLGPIKAYATEVCRKEYNHLALAVVSSSRGIGLIIGPAIGGYLAQPADKYPSIFSQTSIFGRFPYFLPCLCISILAVIALIACIWFPETLHKHNGDAVDNSVETVEESLAGTDTEENGGGGCLKLFTNWPLMSAITLYCIFSLQDVAYAETFSLWAVSDRSFGGLSFTTTDVGNVLAMSGLFLFLYQMLIYPFLAKTVDHITLVRAVALLTLPVLASYPFFPSLSGFGLMVVVNCASFLKNTFSALSVQNLSCVLLNCFQVTTITVFNILMNEAVTQDVRAAANGIAVTLMSISKAVAPAVAGIIFSWAQRRQTAAFLPGDHLVFFILNIFTFIGFVFTFRPFFVRGSAKH
ncbi:Carbohydrate transporter/ sugar porter/ transporter [Zea mays]|uniref:Carbohydrate transporter/ sugar porter/ transporter n=1 Tax=Zea mays TaxID=4577 RepID=A0A1D6MQN1_MAIZE|nr:Carbohydrate transporter/ sugar porter/ transporter [Zea mays]